MHAGYGDAGDTGYIIWKTLASVCEVKYRSHSHLDLDARLQIVDKAFFTLSSQLDRRYFIGLSLCGPELCVLLFSRGGSAITAPIDIHADPLQFMYVLVIFSLGHLSWLGYDDHILVAPGDSLILKFADNAYKIIQPLFAASSIQGRGTRIFVIEDETGNQFILKDCWIHEGWLTDIEVHQLLQDSRRDQPEEDQTLWAIFGPDDQYAIFKGSPLQSVSWDNKDLPGIPICHKHEYVRCDICGGDDTIERILGKCSSSYEPRRHIWVSFKTCAVPITWFSCVREFFNAAMGILVGKKCVQHPPLVFTSVITRSLQRLEKEASPPFRSKRLQHLDVHPICK